MCAYGYLEKDFPKKSKGIKSDYINNEMLRIGSPTALPLLFYS